MFEDPGFYAACRLIPDVFVDYPYSGLGFHNHQVGYIETGVWYEPTGRPLLLLATSIWAQGSTIIPKGSSTQISRYMVGVAVRPNTSEFGYLFHSRIELVTV